MATMSYEDPTGRQKDELEMDSFFVVADCVGGDVVVWITCLTGYVVGKYKINYYIQGG